MFRQIQLNSLKIMRIILVILLCFREIASQKCSSKDNLVTCQNIFSFAEIADEIDASWRNVEIVNKIGAQFSIADSSSFPQIGTIQYLDLTRAGKLTLDDTGFRNFDSLTTLNVSNTKIERLQANWFLRKNIVTLIASKNKITTIKREDMRVLTKVKSLNLSSNAISLIEANAFSDMKQLEVLRLNDNNIQEVIFGPVENLKLLNLKDNSFVLIKVNTFARLIKLEKLTLSNNQINNIQNGAFGPLEKLTVLNISNNNLEQIRLGMFSGLMKAPLAELDLSNNNIKQIAPASLDMFRQLLYFDLSDNSLKEINSRWLTNMNRLKVLLVKNNNIATIQVNAFISLIMLETLDLSGNEITIVNPTIYGAQRFSANRLKVLNLAHNKIDNIGPNFLTILTNLEVVDLSQNELKNFSDVTFKANTKLRKIFLNHNNLEFLPSGIFDSLMSLQEIRFSDNKLTYLPAVGTNPFPKLQAMTLENNPWQCPCLHDTIKWSLKKKLQINREFYDGSKPNCVVTPVKFCVRDQNEVRNFGVFDRYLDATGTTSSEFGNDDEFK